MKLMDAFNRIERVASENSRMTVKVKEAVGVVAAELLTRIIRDADVTDWPILDSRFVQADYTGQNRGFLLLVNDHYYELRSRPACGSWTVDFDLETRRDTGRLAHATVWDRVNGNESANCPHRVGVGGIVNRLAATVFAEDLEELSSACENLFAKQNEQLNVADAKLQS